MRAASSPMRYRPTAVATMRFYDLCQFTSTGSRRGAPLAECRADLGGRLLQRRPWLRIAVARRKRETEAVTVEPRDHVKVDMEDLLPRGLAVRDEKVHSLGAHPRATDRRPNSSRERPHDDGRFVVELRG